MDTGSTTTMGKCLLEGMSESGVLLMLRLGPSLHGVRERELMSITELLKITSDVADVGSRNVVDPDARKPPRNLTR